MGRSDTALSALLLLVLPLLVPASNDPFVNCGAGEAGIEVLRGELDAKRLRHY